MRATPTPPVGAAAAAHDRAAVAEEVCRGAAEDGFLDEVGLAYGECVDLVLGRAADLGAGLRSAPLRAPTDTTAEGRRTGAANRLRGQG